MIYALAEEIKKGEFGCDKGQLFMDSVPSCKDGSRLLQVIKSILENMSVCLPPCKLTITIYYYSPFLPSFFGELDPFSLYTLLHVRPSVECTDSLKNR